MERRRFSRREKAVLYLAADGRCESCGVELEPGWHGDHVQPYSRGGKTDVINGQALCPDCNLKKGDKMSDLRDWQAAALSLFLGRGGDFLTVATPGAGKTTFALTAARQLIERDEIAQIIAVVPTAHLRGQWASAAARMGIQLDHLFVNGNSVLAKDFDGTVVTYQTVAANPLLWQRICSARPTLVILDEIHHAGEAEHLSWGPALKLAFEPAARRLLLSGTPFRSDGKPIPFVKYAPDKDGVIKCDPSFSYDYGAALQDGEVVRQIAFPALKGEVTFRDRETGKTVTVDISQADEDTIANAMKAAYSPSGDWIPSVLRLANEELTRKRVDIPDAAGLVVAADQYKARAYADILAAVTGEIPAVAISDDPDASKVITRFAKGTSRWIIAVQMVSEGVDIPRLAVGVYASRTKTAMFFRQVVGRFVRTRGPEDATIATLFIPSIQPLYDHAREIEQTIALALAEEEERIRREVKEAATQTSLQFEMVEVIGSREAESDGTIFGGDGFSDADLARAAEVKRLANSSVSEVEIARLLRLGGAGRPVGTVTMQAQSAAAPPLADQKKNLRTLIKRKMGRLAHVTGEPHSHIHAQLNKLCREKSIKVATVETLDKRLEILDRWLEQT
jgi:superfamily II DNA or RNA helicase